MYLWLGIMGFSASEMSSLAGSEGDGGLRILHSAYFAFTTLTTIGYGDMSPDNHSSRVIAIFWIYPGLVLMAGMVEAFSAFVIQQQQARDRQAKKDCGERLEFLDEGRGLLLDC